MLDCWSTEFHKKNGTLPLLAFDRRLPRSVVRILKEGLVDSVLDSSVDLALEGVVLFEGIAENQRGLKFDIEWLERERKKEWSGLGRCPKTEIPVHSQGKIHYFPQRLFPQTPWYTVRYLSPNKQVLVLISYKEAQKRGLARNHST